MRRRRDCIRAMLTAYCLRRRAHEASLVSSGGVVIVCVVAIPLLVSAQNVPKRIFVSALDTGGRPVADLTAADFQITEDGVKRTVTRVTSGSAPLRIVLMVDSSTPTAPMMNNFRIALNAFVDMLPAEHRDRFHHHRRADSACGRSRRPTASSSRRRSRRFASEGGANAFLETMIEADTRFLKPAPAQWPVFVIVTTDNGDTRREPDIARYNRFMNDFLNRGGAAHAVVIAGKQSGPVTDLAQNLVENTGGIYTAIVVDRRSAASA